MLYIVDEKPALRDMLRKMLYRHRMFCETVGLSDLPNRVENDPNAVLYLPCLDDYAMEDVSRLSSIVKSHHLPVLYSSESSQIHENLGKPVPKTDEKRIASSLIAVMDEWEKEGKCRYIALSYHGIHDDLKEEATMLYGLPIALTPTERMVLRYMLYKAPSGATAEELMRFCLRPFADLSKSNIPTHIKGVNNAFYPCFRGRIITHKAGAYRLMESLPFSV